MGFLAKIGLLIVLVAGAAWAQEVEKVAAEHEEPEVWVDTSRRELELPAEATLRVVNSLGDVRARSSGDDKLLLVIVTQRFTIDQKDAQVEVSELPDGLSIETRYPSAIAGQRDGRLAGRIDLSLLVPPGAALEIETRHGLIEAKGVDRDLVARSTSGRIRITSARSVSARTDEGITRVALKQVSTANPARFESRGGSIRVDFLDTPGLPVRAMTRGEIIPRMGGELASEVERIEGKSEFRVGAGALALELVSQTGLIELRAVDAHELR
jgi:hypothetical protein